MVTQKDALFPGRLGIFLSPWGGGGSGGSAGALGSPQPPAWQSAGLSEWVSMDTFHLAFALTARALDKWCRPVQVKSILTFASGVTGL